MRDCRCKRWFLFFKTEINVYLHRYCSQWLRKVTSYREQITLPLHVFAFHVFVFFLLRNRASGTYRRLKHCIAHGVYSMSFTCCHLFWWIKGRSDVKWINQYFVIDTQIHISEFINIWWKAPYYEYQSRRSEACMI